MGRLVRAISSRGFTTDLVEQRGELIAQAAGRRGGIVGFPTRGRLGETRGDGQRLAGIGKAHLVQVVILQAFEMPFGGVEDGFGQGVLAVAVIKAAEDCRTPRHWRDSGSPDRFSDSRS